MLGATLVPRRWLEDTGKLWKQHQGVMWSNVSRNPLQIELDALRSLLEI